LTVITKCSFARYARAFSKVRTPLLRLLGVRWEEEPDERQRTPSWRSPCPSGKTDGAALHVNWSIAKGNRLQIRTSAERG